jgi:hypothetical protein
MHESSLGAIVNGAGPQDVAGAMFALVRPIA